ncbi:MAG: MaoC family dehydratase [Candidatus Thermoplasmatota archaeon]
MTDEQRLPPMSPILSAALVLQAAMLRGVSNSFAAGASIQRAATEQMHESVTSLATPLALPVAGRDAQPEATKLPGTPADVSVGMEVLYTREVTDGEVEAFAEACGDRNPLHFDEAYAQRNTSFGGPIAHGLLTASFVSAALSRLPGVAIYLDQDLHFVKPVRRGDVVTAHLKVIERPAGKPWARIQTTCALADGTVVLEGHAKVLLLPEKA